MAFFLGWSYQILCFSISAPASQQELLRKLQGQKQVMDSFLWGQCFQLWLLNDTAIKKYSSIFFCVLLFPNQWKNSWNIFVEITLWHLSAVAPKKMYLLNYQELAWNLVLSKKYPKLKGRNRETKTEDRDKDRERWRGLLKYKT